MSEADRLRQTYAAIRRRAPRGSNPLVRAVTPTPEEYERLEALKECLLKEPMNVTDAVALAKEIGVRTTIARAAINEWCWQEELGERHEKGDGPGRPQRIIGGPP